MLLFSSINNSPRVILLSVSLSHQLSHYPLSILLRYRFLFQDLASFCDKRTCFIKVKLQMNSLEASHGCFVAFCCEQLFQLSSLRVRLGASRTCRSSCPDALLSALSGNIFRAAISCMCSPGIIRPRARCSRGPYCEVKQLLHLHRKLSGSSSSSWWPATVTSAPMDASAITWSRLRPTSAWTWRTAWCSRPPPSPPPTSARTACAVLRATTARPVRRRPPWR